jgi:enterochelin esterase-like enzyme
MKPQHWSQWPLPHRFTALGAPRDSEISKQATVNAPLSLYLALIAVVLSASPSITRSSDASRETPEPTAQYALGPDSQPNSEVPKGKIYQVNPPDSQVFPGFEHRWWLYVPAQYTEQRPAALMVFQDGELYLRRDGPWRAPVVLDNLIAKRDLPVIIGVFVDPGIAIAKFQDGRPYQNDRSVEYDTLSADYATFLLTEILPEVHKRVSITTDPEGHGIAGCSSGGIAAFTVAWQRPDEFRKVLSFSGSFANLRGGQRYPEIVRREQRRPIRVFQLSDTNDIVFQGLQPWFEANSAMAAALKERKYDHRFVYGNDTHCGLHGESMLPDALRWLWRDYPR